MTVFAAFSATVRRNLLLTGGLGWLRDFMGLSMMVMVVTVMSRMLSLPFAKYKCPQQWQQ